MGRRGMLLVVVTAIGAGALLPILVTPSTLAPDELTTLEGTLTKDQDGYAVDGMTAHFGPDRYITTATAPADYDGDGSLETIAFELDGLVDTIVTLDGHEKSSFGDSRVPKRLRRWADKVLGDGFGERSFDVYTINGLPYRDLDEERPPWAGGDADADPATPGASA